MDKKKSHIMDLKKLLCIFLHFTFATSVNLLQTFPWYKKKCSIKYFKIFHIFGIQNQGKKFSNYRIFEGYALKTKIFFFQVHWFFENGRSHAF